jgi:hypothetical protein
VDVCGAEASGMAGSGPGILEKEGSKPVVLCDCPAGFKSGSRWEEAIEPYRQV